MVVLGGRPSHNSDFYNKTTVLMFGPRVASSFQHARVRCVFDICCLVVTYCPVVGTRLQLRPLAPVISAESVVLQLLSDSALFS